MYGGAQVTETKGGVLTVKTYWPFGAGVEIDVGTEPTELNWIHADRLGSPVAISDLSGALNERLAYDAWGKRRSTDGKSTPDKLDGVIDNRGFTNHEMLDQLELVHMNGRVYDPSIGRFVSADPMIGDPINGQNYNRYSYVLNNPTNLTDPTGCDSEDCSTPESCVTGNKHECKKDCEKSRDGKDVRHRQISDDEWELDTGKVTSTTKTANMQARVDAKISANNATTPGKGFWDPKYDPNAYPGSGWVDMANGLWNAGMSLGSEMRAGTTAVVAYFTGDDQQVSASISEMKQNAPGAIMAVVIISGKAGRSAAVSAEQAKMTQALAARDALAKSLAPLKGKAPATVTA
ncbi:MAG: RHS repeat-associated core domain-containing protein, partial [Solirubrobacteraceae bacterium]|nr:RHS repeat-associated core domain-containing protein [Solirubrobacteraceae bacterium]